MLQCSFSSTGIHTSVLITNQCHENGKSAGDVNGNVEITVLNSSTPDVV